MSDIARADEYIQAAKNLLADAILRFSPIVAAPSEADGYAVYFVAADGRVATAEYANERCKALSDLSVTELGQILDAVDHQEQILGMVEDSIVNASDYALANEVFEAVQARVSGSSTRP